LEIIKSNFSEKGSNKFPQTKETSFSTPFLPAFRFAILTASIEISMAKNLAFSNSDARAILIAPLPVPICQNGFQSLYNSENHLRQCFAGNEDDVD